jgi:nicotinamidase-related amidase
MLDMNAPTTPSTAPDRVVLVIDVQESFRQRPLWAARSNPSIEADINRVVAHARSQGDLVIWVLHSEPGSDGPFDPESGFVRLIDGLDKRADELMITKTSHNCFTTTDLQRVLTKHSIREVVVTGIRTEQCCETTARLANDLGYDVTFLLDATLTFPSEKIGSAAGRSVEDIVADPTTLPCAAMLERTRYALDERFAHVTTIAEWLHEPAVIETR